MHALERHLHDEKARAAFRQSWLRPMESTGTASLDTRQDVVQAAVACDIALLSAMPESASAAVQILRSAVNAGPSDRPLATADALKAAFDNSPLAQQPEDAHAGARELFEATIAALETVYSGASHGTVKDVLRRADWQRDIKEDEQSCLGFSQRLLEHGRRRHRAEGAYGVPCLHAILVDEIRQSIPGYSEGVFLWLRIAIETSTGAQAREPTQTSTVCECIH